MRFSPSSKAWRWLGLGLIVMVLLGWGVRTWAVPALIVRQIQARYEGRVTIGSWWLNLSSAGVTDLALYEERAVASPVWARARRVGIDLGLGDLLRGRFTPGRIVLQAPEIVFRIDREGRPLTRPPLKGGGEETAVPHVLVADAQVTLHQEGRNPMVVRGVKAQLDPGTEGEQLTASTQDPTWGLWQAEGLFADSFRRGTIRLLGTRAQATLDKVTRIPFVPPEVWEHVQPNGPVSVVLTMAWDEPSQTRPIQVQTEIAFEGTQLALPTLGLVAAETTGQMVIADGVVRLEGVRGRSIGGGVEANGTLDFSRPIPQFQLVLDLERVNIEDTPKAWKLTEGGVTGALTGKVDLRVALSPEGADLTGTSGQALIEGWMLAGQRQNKPLRLTLKADGGDLHYESDEADAARLEPRPPVPVGCVERTNPFLISRIGAFHAPDDRLSPAILGLIAFQAPPAETKPAEARPPAPPPAPAPEGQSAPAAPRRGGIILPRTISTEVEFEDVDLTQLLARVEALGVRVPVAVAGRLSLKAKATIPLGALREIKEYAFDGQATLKGASIAGVDLGLLTAHLNLDKGVLDLTDFRGRLVDRPEGGAANPPEPTEPVPAEGPLPPGGFRGQLHAELSPPGKLTARFEGADLPLGELAAPALPRPTPLSGLFSLDVEAGAEVATLADPKAWTVTGRAESVRITYRQTTLDAVSTTFSLKQGRLDVPDLAAKLAGHPLTAQLGADLAAPYAFDGHLDVSDWSLADVMAFVPAAPRPSPIAGRLTARAQARGTLAPLSIQTGGEGRIVEFRTGPVPLGDVPFVWKTEGDEVVVSGVEARPFGGRVTAEARVPAGADGRPVRGSATVTGINTAQLAALVPGEGLKLTGTADGRVEFAIPTQGEPGGSAVQANVQLSAPNLTVQGIPAEGVAASVWVRQGVLNYEILAESLGGKIKFRGDVPLSAAEREQAQLNARIQAVGFRLDDLWKALGVTGAPTHLDGLGALDANLRTTLPPSGVAAHGIVEVRNLHWGEDYPLGQIRGTVAVTPTSWQVESFRGQLLGGQAQGSAWGETPPRGAARMGIGLKGDNIDLSELLAFLPILSDHVEGVGSLRLTGTLAETLRADADVRVTRAQLFRVPLTDLRAPADFVYTPGRTGTLQVRRWSARLAGGGLRGDMRFRIGSDRSYQGELTLGDVDLEPIARVATDARNPATGRVSGRMTWSGRDPAQLQSLQGRVELDLTDASLFELPVFREINRFLGAAQGGLFEDGNLLATVANRQVVLEELNLTGRFAQMHATGTIGFNTELDLDVLINTNEIIPQRGSALIALIPGYGTAVAGSIEVARRVANFLSNRLIKLHVTGTIRSPVVTVDPTVVVTDAAVGFFGDALGLPLRTPR